MYGKDRIKSRAIVLLWGIILVLPVWNAEASGFGLTFSTNTFSGSGQSGDSAVPPGLYCRGGLSWLPGKHLEIELYHIPQITPRLYSQVYFGCSAGWWILERKENSYLNAIVEAGFLYGLDRRKLLNLKITPIVFGCPAFRYAEKFCTLGLLFDLERKRLLWQLQLLAVTLYL
ncbi:hypothetical protein ES707_15447 [subsurface metagenome]